MSTNSNLLVDLMERVYQVNLANEWFEEGRTFGDDVALLHSEVSEMLEEFRDGNIETVLNEKGKPIGMHSEAADVLIRLLDTCKRYGIDLLAETEQKLAFNATRGARHGGKAL